MNALNQKALWRAMYIRLLEMSKDDLGAIRGRFDLECMDDLIQAGFMRGEVKRDTAGIPAFPIVHGITLAGRIFTEDQREYLDSRTFLGRLKSSTVIIFAWSAGVLTTIIAQLIIWYYTHDT